MLIQRNAKPENQKLLVKEYLNLLQKGVDPSTILVLTSNSKKRNDFIKEVKNLAPVGNIGNFKIYSFFGLSYNFILDNWAIVENSIKDDKNRKIIPNLSGLEVSQFIFNNSINEVDFSGYNSKTSLLHQLLRRNSLITLNNLDEDEVKNRADILKESFKDETYQAIKKYKSKTIEKRAFDYIRQINLFEFIYKKIKNSFEYVFIDDGDEITPFIFSYINHIKPFVKEFFIAYDKFGSSRLGYLGATIVDFEKFLNEKPIIIEKNDYSDIYNSIINENLIEKENIKIKSFLKRDEMIKKTIDDIVSLIKKGVKPSEISVITPIQDDYLKYEFLKLKNQNINFNFLTKNEKLNQNPKIHYILEFLKIVNDEIIISPYILKGILIEIFNKDKKKTIQFVQKYKIENANIFSLFEKDAEFKDIFELYNEIKDLNLSNQVYQIAQKYILKTQENYLDIEKINQILKQIIDFEDVFNDDYETKNLNNILLTQLSNTIISENPLADSQIEDNSIVVSTFQKIIDYSYKTKYQFLLDTTNENWIKQDIGPLYNSWVMQKTWNKKSFELEDNINLTKDKVARIIRKLYLLADNITLYSSVYDSLGIENFSGIDKYFKKDEIIENKKEFKKIIPRQDQKKVLDYTGGKLSVLAAAGSGKTTIMLLLVEKLLKGEIIKEIEPKNIFVLTFMESASRNFKERIKSKFPDLKELPNISTIHGLALRIIKENNNYSKLGLDFDFEIIDEIKRSAIINKIASNCSIAQDKVSLYDSAISAYKNELSIYPDFISSNRLFLKVFDEYQKALRKENLLDYDDLLLLSLKLLKENKDVLDYYQNLAKVIIEDEAQDSSFVQQNLIQLLSGKFNNVVRCGDINQAITSTFTNSDVTGFRDFIKNSTKVEMDRCQRCSTGVINLANDTVKVANKNKIDAFSTLFMKPVEGVNIVDNKAYSIEVFEEEKNEEKFILDSIRQIKKQDKNASIAILLRSNYLINKWDNILKTNKIKTYKNSENFINNKLFKVCLLVMEYINDPYDNKTLLELIKILYEEKRYDKASYDYVKSLKEPMFLKPDFDEPFYWDMTYFLYKNHSSIYNMAIDIASFYFSNTPQSINISLFATLVEKIHNSAKTFEDTVKRLFEIQNKSNFSNIKFFLVDETDDKKGKVQIMTLHKSKGDEFDYVFIPSMTKDDFCFEADDLKLKENSLFIQKVKKEPKSDIQLKTEIIEENYRLIYVGITRAKKKLYLTTAKKYKYYYKMKEYKETQLFQGLRGLKCLK